MDGQGDFEEMYRAAGDDLGSLPWANLEPFPALVEWLDGEPAAPGGRALVIGCGYGDDAEELARRGFEVAAFDFAPTAIARARERFPASAVDYRVADLFDLPAEWAGAFDLVVEIRTLQSLPIEDRAPAPAAIAATLAPGGLLWLFALARDERVPGGTRPWSLVPAELARLEEAGLEWQWRRDDPLAEGHYDVTGLLRRPPA
ncbi:MAG: class I SAM-dependent methyltransferase [Solirubrobacterales bacterium]